MEVCPALAFLVVLLIGDTWPPNPRCYIYALAVGIVFGGVLGRVAAVCLFLSRSPRFPGPVSVPLGEETGAPV